eukprot:9095426-Pyramimonas_sp.AAC.1
MRGERERAGATKGSTAGPQKATTWPFKVAIGPRRTVRGSQTATTGPRRASTWGHNGRERAG